MTAELAAVAVGAIPDSIASSRITRERIRIGLVVQHARTKQLGVIAKVHRKDREARVRMAVTPAIRPVAVPFTVLQRDWRVAIHQTIDNPKETHMATQTKPAESKTQTARRKRENRAAAPRRKAPVHAAAAPIHDVAAAAAIVGKPAPAPEKAAASAKKPARRAQASDEPRATMRGEAHQVLVDNDGPMHVKDITAAVIERGRTAQKGELKSAAAWMATVLTRANDEFVKVAPATFALK